jgi:hypothetical protein
MIPERPKSAATAASSTPRGSGWSGLVANWIGVQTELEKDTVFRKTEKRPERPAGDCTPPARTRLRVRPLYRIPQSLSYQF